MRRKTEPTDPRRPVAISYLRFSTPEQAKGDSLRRQTEATAKWCERNGIPLDETLSCRDEGRSAYHGHHRSDDAALGRFLEMVREGRVPRGSYLVIENLDRLSREDERKALRVWMDILDAGINIVQLHPETVFRHDSSGPSDMVDIMRALIELSRGHSESRMKSARTLANWDHMIGLAREGQPMPPRRKDGRRTRAITGRLPGWVEDRDGLLCLIPERVEVVRRIFELARSGYGAGTIMRKLNAEGVPPFGERVEVETGRYRKAQDNRYGAGRWLTDYVRNILSDRRAIGEFQPRDRTGRLAKGDPIPNYYPAAVTPEEFQAARAAVNSRRNPPGAIGEEVANLFGGLLRHARDGQSYYAATRSEGGVIYRVLLNRSSVQGQSRAYTFPLRVFERAILKCLEELDPAEVVEPAPVETVSALRGELNLLRERKAALALELLKGDVAAIAQALRQVEARERELAAQVGEAEELVVAPREDAWRDAKGLIGLLDNAEDREDVRLRLRAAIRRVVDSIWIAVHSLGRHRLCFAQVWFRSGRRAAKRDYLIVVRRTLQNFTGRSPGLWAVSSMPDWDATDLRNPDDAEGMVQWLEAYPLATAKSLLEQWGEPI